MIRLIFLIAFILPWSLSFAQKADNDLSKIQTVAQAEKYIEKNPKTNAKIFNIESSSDTSELHLPLYEKKVGFTFQIGNYNYKILQIDSTLLFRVSYIYLDGSQYSKSQIDSLRKVIISKYRNGTSFTELVEEYSMDGNPNGGDTDWFPEKRMVKEFETAVRKHKKGDIFTVDTPSQNWYHVVLKTFNDTSIKKVFIIKIKKSS